MNFKDYLKSLGYTDDQVSKIVDGMPANKLFIASEENLDVRYTKAKDELAQVKSDLATANKLVTDLKKENTDLEALQTKIKDYEAKVTTLETERAKDRKAFAIKEALTKAGVTDLDYMSYKLGEVEVDKDGTIKDLDNKIKDLQKANPSFFKQADPVEPNDPPKGGYKPIDTKLPKGSPTQIDLTKMTAEEINANWDTIRQQAKK